MGVEPGGKPPPLPRWFVPFCGVCTWPFGAGPRWALAYPHSLLILVAASLSCFSMSVIPAFASGRADGSRHPPATHPFLCPGRTDGFPARCLTPIPCPFCAFLLVSRPAHREVSCLRWAPRLHWRYHARASHCAAATNGPGCTELGVAPPSPFSPDHCCGCSLGCRP